MKKIIVTGGAGFIGSHTVVELIKNAYEPIIIDDLSNSSEKMLEGVRKIIGRYPKFYQIDCANFKEVCKVFFTERTIEGVIHFAAHKSVGESQKSPLKYYGNNLNTLTTIMQVMERFKVKELVFSSSATVYGEADVLPVTESSSLKPAKSAYGRTKQIGEQMIEDAVNANTELGAALLRYFNPIGAHPSGLIGELPLGTPENLVPYILQTAAGVRDKLFVFGNDYDTPDGTCVRDYIHVVDLAKAHVKALNWLFAKGKHKSCEAFNIGTGTGNTVLELIRLFEEVSGKPLNYEIGARREGDIEKSYANCSKAKKLLGWEARYTAKDALKDALKWQHYLEQGDYLLAS